MSRQKGKLPIIPSNDNFYLCFACCLRPPPSKSKQTTSACRMLMSALCSHWLEMDLHPHCCPWLSIPPQPDRSHNRMGCGSYGQGLPCASTLSCPIAMLGHRVLWGVCGPLHHATSICPHSLVLLLLQHFISHVLVCKNLISWRDTNWIHHPQHSPSTGILLSHLEKAWWSCSLLLWLKAH